MDAETSAALEASIKHWERNVAATADFEASVSSEECSLCALFIHSECDGCPVKQRTGSPGCRWSPYDAASRAWVAWDGDDPEARARFVVAAQAERDFLISLREPAPQDQAETVR